MAGAEIALELAPEQRQRTVWRIDGGGGSDDHLRWLLSRGYHIVAKGMNNRRAVALARQVRRWDSYGPNAWLGEVQPPVNYGRPVRVFIKKRMKNNEFVHSYYVSSLTLPSKGDFMTCYDNRGGAEVEQFRNDKSGLGLDARRKHSFAGQKGYILLTDLAHNLLADFYHHALADSPFASYGPKRIVRDLLNTPGRLVFADHRLVRVDLLTQKQFSHDLATCLRKYCSSA
ncbi:MAG: transposase [Anaerolineae bacterium]|nr:transposase [Anaerolineae bacterium]MCB0249456.1 transposase [Anaerolineae bacterium]